MPRPRAVERIPDDDATLVVPVSVAPVETEVPAVPEEEHLPPPPRVPTEAQRTLDDVFELINQRLNPKIIERLSSSPPEAAPKPSMPVRAAKATGRFTKAAVTITGALMLLLQGVAWYEEYRGPIQQAVLIAGRVADLWEAYHVDDDPPPPEPE